MKPLAAFTLLLDLDTCASAPGFFAILALLQRRSGAKVLLVSPREVDDSLLMQLGIGFTDFRVLSGEAPHDYQQAKFAVALAEMQAGRVVQWVDADFGNWHGSSVDNIEGLTIINWAAVAQDGLKPKAVARG